MFATFKPSRDIQMSHFPNILEKIFFWIFQWIYSKILCVIHGGAPRTIPTTKNSILMESASSLASRIRNQKVTSEEVVRTYVNRIREINGVLNCVVDERFEEALAEAKEADELVRSGAKTPKELESGTPFLGVPFTAPESVGIKGLHNTMGIWSRKNVTAKADAGVVSLLREGGAIPVACTNVSEWCFARETNNPVFGRTDNPYDTNRSAGGPFGGEGCLIASSGSPLGVSPSVALPGAFNGVFAHKPSANVSCESAGPMSRSSADLLPALALLSRRSEVDLKLEEPVNLKRMKYYFSEGDDGAPLGSPVNEEIRNLVREAAAHMKNFHKASVERVDFSRTLKTFPLCRANITVRGFCNQELRINKKGKGNLSRELFKAVFGKSRHTFLFILTSLMEQKVRSRKNSIAKEVDDGCNRLLAEFQELLGSDGVFIYPATPTPAFRHNESVAKGFDFGYADVFESLGLPATYCPAGLNSDGLPVGFQVVAAMNQDRLTLAVAREIERIFGGWKPPPTHGSFTLKNTVFHTLSNEKVKTL